MALLLAACTPAGPPAASASPAGVEATPATRVTTPPTSDFCSVPLPQSWRDAIRDSRLPQRPGERWVGLVPAPDGRSAFATVAEGTAAAPMTLVWQRADGSRREVATMPDMFTLPLWAVFDGRWLVYLRSDLGRAAPHGSGGGELFVWDARAGGEPRQLADTNGMPGLLLHDGTLAVTRVLGRHRSEVVRYDLAAGTSRPVASGWVTAVGFRGDDLLWYDDTARRLRSSGAEPAVPPGPLSAQMLTTDGLTTAWTSRDELTLTAWRPGWPAPVRLFRVPPAPKGPPPSLVPHGSGTPPPAVPDWADPFRTVGRPRAVGDLVVFEFKQGWYVADLRSGSYARLAADHTLPSLTGTALLLDPDDTSVPPERHAYSLIHLDRLPPLPGCR
ncbi:hypothetical protein GA0074704_4549 [Micromonospora siamensis]|uniref:WD40-like Beta Propeller Repeat n=1 Tax=Micromonospora siamensis TaxID=299152 RepID=A0A1C5JIP5_9ACTN|nr:hypothetical protein GA0074704_4549 [Micromonospora siamensis]